MRLSVCIPTHHGRAAHLEGALDSLLAQIDAPLEGVVEICVSDNGSQDATRDVVAGRQAARPGVVSFRRFEVNQGFTANLLASVDAASGEYCWLFSSDDEVAPGGLRRVLDLLDRHPDATGATLDPTLYDFAREVVGTEALWPRPAPSPPQAEHRWESAEAAIADCGLYMGVLPAQIVRRAGWAEVAADLDGDFARVPLFPHLAIIFRMVERCPVWLWLPAPTLHMRVDAPNSVSADARTATSYHLETTRETVAIADAVFGGTAGPAGLRRAIWQARFNPLEVAAYKLDPNQTTADDLRLARAACGWFARIPAFWALTFPVLLVPHGVLRRLAGPARVLVRAVMGVVRR